MWTMESVMADYPIIFSASMIRALLAGTKTMTRRLLYTKRKTKNGVPASATFLQDHPPPRSRLSPEGFPTDIAIDEYWTLSPWQRVKPGDRLWCREAWAHDGPDLATVKATCFDIMNGSAICEPYYRATETAPNTLKWRSPIHMPRWASRLTLIVTATKIERVQEITNEDARAEGVMPSENHPGHARPHFALVWTDLHGFDSWGANPEVVALHFRTIFANIDTPEAKAA